jgi:NAD(P)-dependent dehydrogenase (short-subunit alcohol dehydrogenase family)
MTKQVLITGATSGIGKATAKALVEKGYDLHFLARNKSKAQMLVAELEKINSNVKVGFSICDLSLVKSVDTTIDEINEVLNGKIDILLNNAGGIFTEYSLTKEGVEQTFAMNHLGPYHLTERLLPTLLKNKARIINVSSAAHPQAKWFENDLESKNSWSSFTSYANVKLYNIYTAKYWAEKYKDEGITAFALHPGVVRTGFGDQFDGFMKIMLKIFQLMMISPEKGAQTSIYLSTANDIEKYSGSYFAKKKVKKSSALSIDIAKRQKLIDYSNQHINSILND